MFVVSIDIWPHGDWSRPARQTTIVAANDGTGSGTFGNYQAIRIDGEHDYEPAVQRLMLIDAMNRNETAKVEGFPRSHNQDHLPALVAELIEALGCREFLHEQL